MWKRSSQYNTIAQARASLSEPSRPYTPAEPSRNLFRTPATNSAAASAAFSSSLQRPDTSGSYDLRPNTSSYRSSGGNGFGSAALPRAPVPRPSAVTSSGAEVLTFDAPSSTMMQGASMPADVWSGSSAAATALEQPAARDNAVRTTTTTAPPKENVMPSAQGSQHDWWSQTSSLLAQLQPDAPLDTLIKVCDQLWARLRPPSGPSGPDFSLDTAELTRRRKEIISSAARLMERKEPQLLLRLSRFCLEAQTAERSAQLGACKLLFKLSKSERNDERFRDLGLLPLLLHVLHPEHILPDPENGRPSTAAVPGPAAVASEPVGGAEALLYAAGALKLTSKDAVNQKSLLSLGAVTVFAAALRAQTAKLLRPSNKSEQKEGKGVKPAHVLVQLTEALRNVAISGSSRKQFVNSGCVEELCTLFRAAPQNGELCLNVSRVLAKLSLHEDVRSRIDAQPQHINAMVHALSLHCKERQLLIRLCFILGNLSAAHEANREAIARGALPLLLKLLDEYASPPALAKTAAPSASAPAPASSVGVSMSTQAGGPLEGRAASSSSADADAEATGDGPSDAASSSHDATAAPAGSQQQQSGATREADGVGEGSSAAEPTPPDHAERVDVLVKLIRLLAHLAISPAIGQEIASSDSSLSLLRVLQNFTMEKHEELQLNAVSAVTNLSYYTIDGSRLLSKHEDLCEALIPVLVFPNSEGMVEASRALGNLSRVPEARATICRVRVDEALLLLLDHASSQVAEGACGALINLAADPQTRELLLEAGAAPKLADLLLTLLSPPVEDGDGNSSLSSSSAHPSQSTLRSDVGAALLATKTLCNLCCSCTTSPLHAALAQALEEKLSAQSTTPPAHWKGAERSHDGTAELLAEWPQATQLLLRLLARLPAADEPVFAAEEEYEESELEEIPALD